MKLAILLTATIKPHVVGGNFSVAERAEMYASTLRYYAKTIGQEYPIVFVENSDYKLSMLKIGGGKHRMDSVATDWRCTF